MLQPRKRGRVVRLRVPDEELVEAGQYGSRDRHGGPSGRGEKLKVFDTVSVLQEGIPIDGRGISEHLRGKSG